jgi:hypothetical protein
MVAPLLHETAEVAADEETAETEGAAVAVAAVSEPPRTTNASARRRALNIQLLL